jgi:hypothetical protein
VITEFERAFDPQSGKSVLIIFGREDECQVFYDAPAPKENEIWTIQNPMSFDVLRSEVFGDQHLLFYRGDQPPEIKTYVCRALLLRYVDGEKFPPETGIERYFREHPEVA